jgi:aquaporin TIP
MGGDGGARHPLTVTSAVLMNPNIRVLVAEALGTFALVFFGAGSICADALVRGSAAFGAADLVMIALAHAMVLAVMISAVGHISGAHFNPAVTVATLVTRNIEPALAGAYILVQLGSGLFAAILLKAFWSDAVTSAVNFGAPLPGKDVGPGRAFAVEVVLTFFLVTVIYATAIDPRGAFKYIAGLGIGFVLFFDILAGGPLTGAAMNPARAFGPALVAGKIDGVHFLAYWLGPVVGAVLAGLLYDRVLRPTGESDVPPPSVEPAGH